MIHMRATDAASALLHLTSRDRTLVQALDELRYVTAPQARQICYPTITVRSASSRLTILRRRGLLQCLSHRTFEDRRAFWGLTPLGRAAAAALSGAPPDRTDAAVVGALQMDHLIATNQVFCDLCRERRDGRLGLVRWLGSHHAHVDLGQTHLTPDAVILVASPARDWWMYFLERDRGTMSRDALVEKFERYRLMLRLADARADDPAWQARAASWILFACDDTRRAADAARLAASCGLERIWSGAAHDCAASLAAAAGSASTARSPADDGAVDRIVTPDIVDRAGHDSGSWRGPADALCEPVRAVPERATARSLFDSRHPGFLLPEVVSHSPTQLARSSAVRSGVGVTTRTTVSIEASSEEARG
jgi:hypothetical protein